MPRLQTQASDDRARRPAGQSTNGAGLALCITTGTPSWAASCGLPKMIRMRCVSMQIPNAQTVRAASAR